MKSSDLNGAPLCFLPKEASSMHSRSLQDAAHLAQRMRESPCHTSRKMRRQCHPQALGEIAEGLKSENELCSWGAHPGMVDTGGVRIQHWFPWLSSPPCGPGSQHPPAELPGALQEDWLGFRDMHLLLHWLLQAPALASGLFPPSRHWCGTGSPPNPP